MEKQDDYVSSVSLHGSFLKPPLAAQQKFKNQMAATPLRFPCGCQALASASHFTSILVGAADFCTVIRRHATPSHSPMNETIALPKHGRHDWRCVPLWKCNSAFFTRCTETGNPWHWI
jgi:hypothetical protein